MTLIELRTGSFLWGRAMGNGGVFPCLRSSSCSTCMICGQLPQLRRRLQRIPAYGYVYLFIELLLGIAYVTAFQPFATNLVTLVVMSVSSVGVIQSLLNKRNIRCACLGTVFNLPASTASSSEHGLMGAMAAFALFAGGH